MRADAESSRRQRRIADVLERLVADHDVRFVLSLGDNIYQGEQGRVDQEGGGEDDDWYSSFFQPYRLAIARVPIFPAIGNHDSADTEGSDDRAEMEDNFHIHERFHHGLETASVMPGLFYRLRYGADLELACLDTSLDSEHKEIHRYFQAPKHQEWLRSTFGRRADRWLIPYSHHPVYTAGPNHQNDEEMRDALEPFFDAADVRLVLAGHEHNFQVSEVGGRTYVVSGAAGQVDEKVPEGFTDAYTTAWGAQAHLLLIDIDGSEATVTPIAGLLDDGRIHLMTALTPRNELVEPPLRVRLD
jgi:DNA repair exonuclease SbcCD nuclease subunit